MIQIRQKVFETNSSSTHSLILCDDETYKKFQSGEIFIDWEKEEFVTLDELRDAAKKVIDPEDRWHTKYPSPQEIDMMDPLELIVVLEDWYLHYGVDSCGIHREMTLPSGEKVHALSEYYCDG